MNESAITLRKTSGSHGRRIFFSGPWSFIHLLRSFLSGKSVPQFSNIIPCHSHDRYWERSLLLPAIFANAYLNAFYFGAVSFLVLAFFLRQNYIVRFLFFYLTFNLYVINLPLANGSDIVLFMLSLWCIPMGRYGPIKINDKWHLQKVLYNLALMLCQIQIVNTYLISGLDKLLSETWRSGEAFTYIRHLEFFYNPVLPQGLENSAWNFILSWCTILFELSFVVLVWNRHTRIATIIVGVIFNLFIWIVLSIPDFALLMIISFLIFLKDEDFQVLKIGKSGK